MNISSFKVWGSYPNRRSIFLNLGSRLSKTGGNPVRLSGYTPPIVFYSTGEGGGPTEISVRDIDLPFLCQSDLSRARRHLEMLIDARRGDGRARGVLFEEELKYRESSGMGFQAINVSASEFVVPSTCEREHSVERVSHKGSILLNLCRSGYPVPDFVILTSQAYLNRDDKLHDFIEQAMSGLEELTGRKLGSREDPLLLALRCAMPRYLPGVMPTYLNVGVAESTMPALERIYGPGVAARLFLNNAKNLLMALYDTEWAYVSERLRPQMSHEEVQVILRYILAVIKRKNRNLVENPIDQVIFFVREAYRHYEENEDLLATLSKGTKQFPSIIMQKMVCSVRSEDSHAGVVFSRHSMTGEGRQLETANNIFGEEIMTGTVETRHTNFSNVEEVRKDFPALYHFLPRLERLEKEFQSPVTIEFVVETTKNHQLFALLQLNNTEMTGRAAFISVMDLYSKGIIPQKRVTELICPYHIKQMETDAIDSLAFKSLYHFSRGVHILPRSAVCARIYFSAQAALVAKRHGDRVCFCKKTFIPGDTVVMREMDAIVSLTSAAIHVVTICQSFGVPALLNLEKFGTILLSCGKLINASGEEIREGEWVTISSRKQVLFRGRAQFKPARLLRFMRGESVKLESGEKAAFEAMAFAYSEYQKLVKNLKLSQISTLNELIRLVNLEFRGEREKAEELVNRWFDVHKALYVDEVLMSDMGDHMNQHTVFDLLSLDRKIGFFKSALPACAKNRISGYSAGAFMLGRFLCISRPISFWESFDNSGVALMINEWLLFEKYMRVLNEVGEKKVFRVRKRLFENGLESLTICESDIKHLVTLKLSSVDLNGVRKEIPSWCDPQTDKVIEFLERPYGAFFDFNAVWSIQRLEKICRTEKVRLPKPDEC